MLVATLTSLTDVDGRVNVVVALLLVPKIEKAICTVFPIRLYLAVNVGVPDHPTRVGVHGSQAPPSSPAVVLSFEFVTALSAIAAVVTVSAGRGDPLSRSLRVILLVIAPAVFTMASASPAAGVVRLGRSLIRGIVLLLLWSNVQGYSLNSIYL
ncbi:MAG TPA: hypothetical protein VL020_06445 [Pseudomonadales bacterium]|nr:hypothetical protein [Pseudomonadales bacterium]